MIRKFLLLFCMFASATLLQARNQWPDGSAIDKWFNDTTWRNLDQLPQYVVTSYGVKTDSTLMQTTALQHVIDLAARQGGGVVVIPRGTFLSGSLFFRQGTHLLLRQGAKLKGKLCVFLLLFLKLFHCSSPQKSKPKSKRRRGAAALLLKKDQYPMLP